MTPAEATLPASATEAPALAAWRREVRDWFENHPVPALPSLDNPVVDISGHQTWEQSLAHDGLAAVHWPVEHGGRAADQAQRLVFQQEYERAGGPPRVNIQGLMLAGPTLMAFGTPEQQRRWIPGMLTADEVWCQGFSEPGAGSDLAALRTKAVQRGERLVVDGQKIWTTGAHYADWIFALVRTGTEESRHRGITWVMIDLSSPGVEVRPIPQLNGRADFAEVFFDGVEVPLDHVIGGIDGGWRVAMSALGFERGVGRRSHVQYLRRLDQLRSCITQSRVPVSDDIEREFGAVLAQVLMYRDFIDRVAAETDAGATTHTPSYNKLIWSELQIRLFDLGERVMRATGRWTDPEFQEETGEWSAEYWYSRASRIFAGTNQVQRTIIADRVLELPR